MHHACFRKLVQVTYACLSKIAYAACNAQCIFSKDAERDAVMHQRYILIDIK